MDSTKLVKINTTSKKSAHSSSILPSRAALNTHSEECPRGADAQYANKPTIET